MAVRERRRRGEATAAGPGRGAPAAVLACGLVAFGAAVAAYALMVLAHPHALWTMPDLRVYRWGGLLARHSHRLYDATIDGFGFTYPPLAAAIFAVLSVLSMPTLRWLSALSGLVALVLSVAIAGRMLGHRRAAISTGAALAVSAAALWTEPVLKTLWFGQINLVLMLVVLADLSQRDGRRWKGAAIGVATGIKLTPAVFVAYLIVTRRFRAAAVAAGTFLVTVAAGFAALPHESRQYWLGGLFLSPGRVGPVDWSGNQSLYGMLVRLFGGEHAARPYWIAAAVPIAAAGLGVAAWQSRRGEELVAVVTCAVTGLLLSPISWSHHWVWIAPVLVLAADRALRGARRARRPRTGPDAPGSPRTATPTRGSAPPPASPSTSAPVAGVGPASTSAPAPVAGMGPASASAPVAGAAPAGSSSGSPARAWVRAGAGVAAAVALEVLFGAWVFRTPGLPALPQGLIRTVPFGKHREERWHGVQLLVGNLYVVLALAALLVLLALTAVALRQRLRAPAAGARG